MADTPNNITKLLTALLAPMQELESVYQQLAALRFVDTATDAQLDAVGKIVGQPRNGMVDDDYRRLIRARIRVNRSKGTLPDVLTVADLVVYNDLAYLHAELQGIAALVLRVEGIPLPTATRDLLIGMERNTVSAGVRLVLESSTQVVANWMKLDVDTLDGPKTMIGAVA